MKFVDDDDDIKCWVISPQRTVTENVQECIYSCHSYNPDRFPNFITFQEVVIMPRVGPGQVSK